MAVEQTGRADGVQLVLLATAHPVGWEQIHLCGIYESGFGFGARRLEFLTL